MKIKITHQTTSFKRTSFLFFLAFLFTSISAFSQDLLQQSYNCETGEFRITINTHVVSLGSTNSLVKGSLTIRDKFSGHIYGRQEYSDRGERAGGVGQGIRRLGNRTLSFYIPKYLSVFLIIEVEERNRYGNNGFAFSDEHWLNYDRDCNCQKESISTATSFSEGWEKSWTNYGNGKVDDWRINNGDIFCPGDFDGDGIDELLTFSNERGAMMQTFDTNEHDDWKLDWSNDGSGTISNWTLASNDKFYVGDFNGDGREELLITNPRSSGATSIVLRWVDNQWTGLVPEIGTNYGMAPYRHNLYVGDFDGDGKDELQGIDIGGWATMFHYGGGNTWQWGWSTGSASHGINSNGYAYQVGDFDGDGDDEMFGVNSTSSTIYSFNGSGWEREWTENGGQKVVHRNVMEAGKFSTPGTTQILGMAHADGYITEFFGPNLNWRWSTYSNIERSSSADFFFMKTGINDREQLIEVVHENNCGGEVFNIYDFLNPHIAFIPRTFVPDDAFESKLIALGYDDVLDDFVLTENIEDVTELRLANSGIQDLTGIEDFSAVSRLFANSNHGLGIVDLSSNLDLSYLDMDRSGITELILPDVDNLELIDLQWNPLTSLDVSGNPSLEKLYLSGVHLTNLDVTSLSNLEHLYVHYSRISSLDLSNNSNLNRVYFHKMSNLKELDLKNGNNESLNIGSAKNIPNLSCVVVDDSQWAQSNMSSKFDDNVSFVESPFDCGSVSSNSFEVYPTRVTDFINLGSTIDALYMITNLTTGATVGAGGINANQVETISCSSYTTGIYVVRIISKSPSPRIDESFQFLKE